MKPVLRWTIVLLLAACVFGLSRKVQAESAAREANRLRLVQTETELERLKARVRQVEAWIISRYGPLPELPDDSRQGQGCRPSR